VRILTIIPLLLLIGGVLNGSVFGQTSPVRHGIKQDLKSFPQDTPQAVKGSILKALETANFDYLIAHLIDLEFIDRRIAKSFEGKLENQVRETKGKLVGTELGNQLRMILKEGKLTTKDTEAVLIHPKLGSTLVVRFVKIEDLWYMDNRKSQE
jgi:hypothetical protein